MSYIHLFFRINKIYQTLTKSNKILSEKCIMCVCCNNIAECSLDIRNDTNMQTQLIRKLYLLKAGR